MKIILPTAGKGTRLRPHTFTRAKSLVSVAGKTILGHIIDNLLLIKNLDEIIFIVDENGEQIEYFVNKNYPDLKTKYIIQEDKKGPAHAVWLAKNYINSSDLLIMFNDSIIFTEFAQIPHICNNLDGLIFSKEVENYKNYGVNVVKDGIIIDMVEKPDKPISNLAQVGLYYFKNGMSLMEAIEETINKQLTVKGEYYLPSAFKLLINKGFRLGAPLVDEWLDCGTKENLLKTNRYLLEKNNRELNEAKYFENSIIIPPVSIGENVEIVNSIIGPFVSIADNCKVIGSRISDSIINSSAEIEKVQITHSLIGENVMLVGSEKSLDIGDNSVLRL